jgi:cytochrome c biogenesis protein CcdA
LLEILIPIALLGLGASFCPIQVAFLIPFAGKLLSGEGHIQRVIIFSACNSIPLIFTGVVVTFIGSIFSLETMRLATAVILVVVSLFIFRVIRLNPKGFLNKSRFAADRFEGSGVTLGFAYGFLTVGRGAPFFLSALALLLPAGNVVLSVLSMLVYSMLMVMPVLVLLVLTGWKLEQKLKRFGKFFDYAIGFMLLGLAVYYIVISVSAIML